ncbi:MAG: complex I 51 kDa subunit family protein, partial [Limisphaerales bacterium]
MCHRTPMIEVVQPGKPAVTYAGMGPSDARELVLQHFRPKRLSQKISRFWTRALDSLLLDEPKGSVTQRRLDPRKPEVSEFLGRQVHIATECFGKVDPLDLDEYVANGGFQALARCLGVAPPQVARQSLKTDLASPCKSSVGISLSASEGANKEEEGGASTSPGPWGSLSVEQIIATIERSGLRGRGGAGFPTGKKWRAAREQPGEVKYVICNGDEGDPGAFMDRMLLESFPCRIIEGLAIAAVAAGAHDCIFYIRHEYPLAVKRVRAAIKLCQQRGWIGERPFGAEYPLRFVIKEGAGAFVCGEETALIASIEGQRGMPRLRPPLPVEQGLWGKPTLINNVETLAMVPWILRHGPEAFAALGTKDSKGTKVFALAGNVQRGGLIEIPMGTSIREIVNEIGGGVRPGRKFKAVQIGGPSGGCVPARLSDTPVDFESLREVGAIM